MDNPIILTSETTKYNVINRKSEYFQKDSVAKQFRDSKRRFFQHMMVKCGKTEPTNDAQYKELKRRHQELYRHVKYSTVHVKNYMSNMIAMGYSCGRIGEDSIMFKDQNSTTAFSNAMNRLEEGAREMADQNMIKLIEMFQMKLDDLRDLKREMKEREKLKLDYDSALRKVCTRNS